MVTPARAIAMLLSLAILLAGPASALAGAWGDCCCQTPSTSQTDAPSNEDAPAGGECCSQEPADPDREPAPERGHQDCDCTMPCCTAGKTVPLARAHFGLELPDALPDAFIALEPESHAVEAHFSLLRPPRS